MSCEFEQTHSSHFSNVRLECGSYFQSRKGKCKLSEATKRVEENIEKAPLHRENFY